MKGVNYSVDIILLECKRIKGVFAKNTEIAENIISRFMLMLPASTYTKITSSTTIGVIGLGIASDHVEVGL